MYAYLQVLLFFLLDSLKSVPSGNKNNEGVAPVQSKYESVLLICGMSISLFLDRKMYIVICMAHPKRGTDRRESFNIIRRLEFKLNFDA